MAKSKKVQWSLPRLLSGLHEEIQQKLEVSRQGIGHPGAKGDASEGVWLLMLQKYLPYRYQAEKGYVVDHLGVFSDQIDVVIFDRQYTPMIFEMEGGLKIIPAEGVYAGFECKQTIDSPFVKYSQKKIASIRNLSRTSLPIPHAGGTYPPKPLGHILGGILTFESSWTPKLGQTLKKSLCNDLGRGRLDLGCVAAHGHFEFDGKPDYKISSDGKPATAFLFNLISLLQQSATVPMIDIMAYARWLDI